MKLLIIISNLIMPFALLSIILYGYKKKIDIYETFIEGALEGAKIIFKIFPTLVGLMTAVGILSTSGALNSFGKLFRPMARLFGFPQEAVPLIFMRLISSSASTGLLLDIFKKYGPDSFIGKLVSIMMYCTETIFYTISVYFMNVKIKKIRYTLKGALIANLIGVIASFFIAKIFA